MESLKNAVVDDMGKERAKTDALELTVQEAERRVNKVELQLNDLLESYSRLEADYETCQGDLKNAQESVERKESALTCAQLQVNSLQQRIAEIDGACKICQNKLKDTLDKMAECHRRADESNRIRCNLELGTATDNERFKELEAQVEKLDMWAEEAEVKIEETVGMIDKFEKDLELAEMQIQDSEMRFLGLQEQIQLVASNFKSIEVTSDQSRLKEGQLKRRTTELKNCVKQAELRAIKGEQHFLRLLAEIDKLTAELKSEREKLESISFEMETTLSELE